MLFAVKILNECTIPFTLYHDHRFVSPPISLRVPRAGTMTMHVFPVLYVLQLLI